MELCSRSSLNCPHPDNHHAGRSIMNSIQSTLQHSLCMAILYAFNNMLDTSPSPVTSRWFKAPLGDLDHMTKLPICMLHREERASVAAIPLLLVSTHSWPLRAGTSRSLTDCSTSLSTRARRTSILTGTLWQARSRFWPSCLLGKRAGRRRQVRGEESGE